MKITYDKLAKIYTKYFDHMTKMATTLIYDNPLNIFFSGIKRSMALGLVCTIGDVGPTSLAQIINLG